MGAGEVSSLHPLAIHTPIGVVSTHDRIEVAPRRRNTALGSNLGIHLTSSLRACLRGIPVDAARPREPIRVTRAPLTRTHPFEISALRNCLGVPEVCKYASYEVVFLYPLHLGGVGADHQL